MSHADESTGVAGMSMIPTPTVGAGSADIQTESRDPDELRSLLDRARERLAFYESFDRIIGENTRRTGELMLETIARRERARQREERAAADHAAHDDWMRQELQRNVGLLDALAKDLAGFRHAFDELETRLQAARETLNANASATAPAQDADTESPAASPVTADPAAEHPVQTLAAEPAAQAADDSATADAPAAEPPQPPAEVTTADVQHPAGGPWSSPQPVDLIVHGITRAPIALSLQRYLRELDHVASVDAREFAGGVLRLQVQSLRPLDRAALAGWEHAADVTIRESADLLLEFELPSPDSEDAPLSD